MNIHKYLHLSTAKILQVARTTNNNNKSIVAIIPHKHEMQHI